MNVGVLGWGGVRVRVKVGVSVADRFECSYWVSYRVRLGLFHARLK